MSKKLYAALLPVLAVVALASMTTAAQAEPHWYRNGTRLPFTSAKTQVITWGTLVLHNAHLEPVTCKVSDAGNIWNVSLTTPGKDEVTLFAPYECSSLSCKKGLTVTAEGLPWPTELVAGPPIRVKITGIKIRVRCEEPVVNLLFEGELKPKFVNGTSAEKPSFVEFDAESGHLTNPEVGEATVTGTDKILGFENQELITVVNP